MARNSGWKQFERRLARALGTERIAVTGERNGADFEDGMFCYQAKKRQTFPTYVAEWLDEIRGKAAMRKPTKVGVVILQRPRGQDRDALVVMSFADFLELHGPVNGAVPTPPLPPAPPVGRYIRENAVPKRPPRVLP